MGWCANERTSDDKRHARETHNQIGCVRGGGGATILTNAKYLGRIADSVITSGCMARGSTTKRVIPGTRSVLATGVSTCGRLFV